jgi:hypothetical protein
MRDWRDHTYQKFIENWRAQVKWQRTHSRFVAPILYIYDAYA